MGFVTSMLRMSKFLKAIMELMLANPDEGSMAQVNEDDAKQAVTTIDKFSLLFAANKTVPHTSRE